MKRTATIAFFTLAAPLALAGCQDLGLEGNIPLAEAEDRAPSELVAAVYAPTEVQDQQLIVDGRLWVPQGAPLTVSARELRPVGSAGGKTVHARSWDQAPYDALFTELPPQAPTDSLVFGPQEGTQWQEWAPVIGRSGALPPAGADHDAAAPGHGAPDPGHETPAAGGEPGAAAGH